MINYMYAVRNFLQGFIHNSRHDIVGIHGLINTSVICDDD